MFSADPFVVRQDHFTYLLAYCLTTTVVLIIIAIHNLKSRERYMIWKETVVNLYLVKLTYGITHDDQVRKLLDENALLSAENKALTAEKRKVTMGLFLVLIAVYSKNVLSNLKRWSNRKMKQDADKTESA